jgi:LPS-assembly lipoprotein
MGRAALAVLGLALAGCGFQPLYDPGSPAAEMLGRVEVAPMNGRVGFEMRERLIRRLGPASDAEYLLEVDLDLRREGVAITQKNITTRYNVIGNAEFRLMPIAGGAAVLKGDVFSLTGYSAPDDETTTAFASRAAEKAAETRLALTLADQIVTRLALGAASLPP